MQWVETVQNYSFVWVWVYSYSLSLKRLNNEDGFVWIKSTLYYETNFVNNVTACYVKCFYKMDDNSHVKEFLLKGDTDFIALKHNPPFSSNFGGVWKRRAILQSHFWEHTICFLNDV